MAANTVFINCPFDKAYQRLLKPMLFTLVALKLEPMLTYPKSYLTGRMDRMEDLIKNSTHSVHDLSRCTLPPPTGKRKQDYSFGYNNAFELGFEIACERIAPKQKNALLMADQENRYKKYFSDAGDLDAAFHKGKPEAVVKIVHDWMDSLHPKNNFLEAQAIWILYTQFNAEGRRAELAGDILNQKSVRTYSLNATKWLSANTPAASL